MLFNVDGALFLQAPVATCHKETGKRGGAEYLALFLGAETGVAISGMGASMEGGYLDPYSGGTLLSSIPKIGMCALALGPP